MFRLDESNTRDSNDYFDVKLKQCFKTHFYHHLEHFCNLTNFYVTLHSQTIQTHLIKFVLAHLAYSFLRLAIK